MSVNFDGFYENPITRWHLNGSLDRVTGDLEATSGTTSVKTNKTIKSDSLTLKCRPHNGCFSGAEPWRARLVQRRRTEDWRKSSDAADVPRRHRRDANPGKFGQSGNRMRANMPQGFLRSPPVRLGPASPTSPRTPPCRSGPFSSADVSLARKPGDSAPSCHNVTSERVLRLDALAPSRSASSRPLRGYRRGHTGLVLKEVTHGHAEVLRSPAGLREPEAEPRGHDRQLIV